MTIPVCACGTPKEPRGDYWRCGHCDGICAKRDGCQKCGLYNVHTNRRVNV